MDYLRSPAIHKKEPGKTLMKLGQLQASGTRECENEVVDRHLEDTAPILISMPTLGPVSSDLDILQGNWEADAHKIHLENDESSD